jgi:hypothetical protein
MRREKLADVFLYTEEGGVASRGKDIKGCKDNKDEKT